jgi:hypothetical protein
MRDNEEQLVPVYDCHPIDLTDEYEPIAWIGWKDEHEAEVMAIGTRHYEGTGWPATTVIFGDNAWHVY